MFTAIVLVCAGEFKTSQDCYTYTHEMLFASEKSCQRVLVEAISTGIFDYYDEMRNEKHTVKDYMCVNWRAERVQRSAFVVTYSSLRHSLLEIQCLREEVFVDLLRA